MTDVIRLLNAPPPWEVHGPDRPRLPAAHAVLLAGWARPEAELFQTSGEAGQVIRQLGIVAPGLLSAALGEVTVLTPATLAELQEAVDAAVASDLPQRLVVRGTLVWQGCLVIRRARGFSMDFAGLTLDVAVSDQPLIKVIDGQGVTLRGLRVGQVNAGVLDIIGGTDIAVTHAALAGATTAAIRLSGGVRRALIDASAFVRNAGASVLAQGEVSDLAVLHCQFDGPTGSPFVHLAAARAAIGYDTPAEGEAGRDAMTLAHPTGVRLLDNRFGGTEAAAVQADGTLALWVERNDFNAMAGSAVVVSGPALGVMIADNRILPTAEAAAPLLSLTGVALFCLFRNILSPLGQTGISVMGPFGGGLIAANSLLIEGTPPAAAVGIELVAGAREDEVTGAFLSTTVMLNTIRGALASGIGIRGHLPRLFLFDNHLFGMTKWSLDADEPQPMATSMNNWSPQNSRNLALSDQPIETGRRVVSLA
jgi:hypothetical protein